MNCLPRPVPHSVAYSLSCPRRVPRSCDSCDSRGTWNGAPAMALGVRLPPRAPFLVLYFQLLTSSFSPRNRARGRYLAGPSPGTERGNDEGSGEHEGQWQTVRGEEASNGKALSDLPALKPYWGKPAVRNFREGNGNVGIIRSPLRAFALPDQSSAVRGRHLSGDGVYLARGLVRRFVIDAPSPHCDKSIKYNRAMAFEPGVEC